MKPPLLKPQDVAKRLGISTRQLRDLSEQGSIPYIDVGLGEKRPARRYLSEDIEAFIEERRRTGGAPPPQSMARSADFRTIDFKALLTERRAQRRAESEEKRKQRIMERRRQNESEG